MNRRPCIDLRTDADLAEEAELKAIAAELSDVRDLRRLALDIVCELIEQLGTGERAALMGLPYKEAFADISELMLDASEGRGPTGIHAGNLGSVHVLADRLCSRFFARQGEGGTWPFELRAPFEVANALRRACEPYGLLGGIVPLMVRDARAMLSAAVAEPARIAVLIEEARS